jgi:hypothetical protein
MTTSSPWYRPASAARSSFCPAVLAHSASVGPPAPAAGQLHHRRRIRHLAIKRDPAKPPPADRIADLGARAL